MREAADEWAVDLRDVAKTYRRRVRALRGVAMRVRRGEIFGLLGPNGAGKTTLVKIMMTVVRANRAGGTVLGRPVGNRAALARIGYLPESPRFPRYLTGRQALHFYGALAKLDRSTRKRRAAALLDAVRLADAADAKLATYSKGMAQRLGVAQALMNDPDLVLLDEPTDGVDPVGRREIRRALQDFSRQGKTVFLNSHMLGEVEMVCERVAILVAGEVVRQGTLDELTRERRFYEIEVAAERADAVEQQVRAAVPAKLAPADAAAPAAEGAQALEGTLPGGERVELLGCLLRVATGDARTVQPLIDALRARDVVIRAVRPVRQSLEDLFMETIGAGADQPILLPPAQAPPAGAQTARPPAQPEGEARGAAT